MKMNAAPVHSVEYGNAVATAHRRLAVESERLRAQFERGASAAGLIGDLNKSRFRFHAGVSRIVLRDRRHRLPNVVDQPKNLAVIAKCVKITGISRDLNNGPCHAISLGREPGSLRRRRQRQRTTKAISSAKARVTVAKTSIGIIVNPQSSPVAPPRCAPQLVTLSQSV
jgi:hypothetical protein